MYGKLLVPISPALVLLGLLLVSLAIFAVRVRRHGYPPLRDADRRESTAIATPFLIRWMLWFLTPIELALARVGVSPNVISLVSLGLCAATGATAATGHFAVATWLYAGAGMLDILDGRVARRTGHASTAGALLDSVLDRWGEFFVLGGLAVALRDSVFGLVSVLLCIAGSQMVSYTRARGESLGQRLAGGTMQRAERIIATSGAMLLTAIGGATGAFDGRALMAVVMFAVGILSAGTSLHRLVTGMAALRPAATAVKRGAAVKKDGRRAARSVADTGPRPA